jgi:hypothetical protein
MRVIEVLAGELCKKKKEEEIDRRTPSGPKASVADRAPRNTMWLLEKNAAA